MGFAVEFIFDFGVLILGNGIQQRKKSSVRNEGDNPILAREG